MVRVLRRSLHWAYWRIGIWPQYAVDSADSLHLQIEAMKLAYADTHRYVSDPNTRDIEYAQLLDPDYLAQRAGLIDLKRAGVPTFGMPRGDTVYLTAADEDGMMVSFIQSNYMGFGSGIVIPDTGISMAEPGCGFLFWRRAIPIAWMGASDRITRLFRRLRPERVNL